MVLEEVSFVVIVYYFFFFIFVVIFGFEGWEYLGFYFFSWDGGS